MTIAVLLKQVPDTTAKISVNGGRVDENAVSKWSFSPYDEYALEAALQLKESAGGELLLSLLVQRVVKSYFVMLQQWERIT